jgi:Ca2+-binding EF-hand superfamily protein
METDEQVLARVRRRLNAAKARSSLTLEQLFNACDKNQSGTLDISELKYAVRVVLKVPPATVCEHEIKILFNFMDRDKAGHYLDKSGGVDLAELFEYLAHGSKGNVDEAKHKAKRLQRVHKNIQMGFQQLRLRDKGEMAVRKLFSKLDMDGEGKLSLFEFSTFVRHGLKLSRWDVMNEDLMQFYKHLDKNGDGVDVDELIYFIRTSDKDMGQEYSFSHNLHSPKVEKKKTYRQQLQELRPSSSTPNLSFGRSNSPRPQSSGPILGPSGVGAAAARAAFSLRPSSSFVNLGRSRTAIVRLK